LVTPTEIVAFLDARVPLFSEFSGERLGELVGGSRLRSFEANEAIVHQGAEAAHFFVILSGTASASVLGDGGVRQDLGTLSAGGPSARWP
jgi:CRP-like cAMP-binding protein